MLSIILCIASCGKFCEFRGGGRGRRYSPLTIHSVNTVFCAVLFI